MSYEAVIEEIKTVPEEYLFLVANYIDTIKKRLSEEAQPKQNKTFGFGALKEYANPALWEKEQSAWALAAEEKYALP